jgi:APA family basic amino acid/polyamine antiporter
VSAVAVGWSQYVNELLHSLMGVRLPAALSAGPSDGGIVNLPAVIVIALASVLLIRGVRESARATAAMAVLKLVVLVAFCAIGFSAFKHGNLTPFSPAGLGGIGAGTTAAFFSYIGFDAITTAGEEAKNPRRDIPIAILVCLGLVTLLYCAVALAAIGAVGGDAVGGRPAALSYVVNVVTGSTVGAGVVAFGAVVAIASVVLAVMYGQTRILMSMSRDGLVPRVFEKISPKTSTPVAGTLIVAIASVVLAVMYGQTRILMSMSRDGLVPRVFEKISPKTSTPVAGTLIVAIVFAVPAAVAPLDAVVNLTTIGTLATMAAVNVAVIALRRREPGLARTFRVPLYPVVPLLAVGFCLYLMYETGWTTWIQFVCFLAAGFLVYVLYGRRNSRLARSATPTAATPDAAERAPQAV